MFWGCPWQGLMAHQGTVAPSLGTAGIKYKLYLIAFKVVNYIVF